MPKHPRDIEALLGPPKNPRAPVPKKKAEDSERIDRIEQDQLTHGVGFTRHANLGPLQELLIRACPPEPNTGRKSIPVLAAALNLTAWGVGRWIKQNGVPPNQAARIVALGGPVTLEEFTPFFFTRTYTPRKRSRDGSES